MKTIIWNEFFSVSDNQAEKEAEKLLEVDEIYTGNALVIDYARLLRVTDQIDSLVIIVNNKEHLVNEYGAMLDWPKEIYHVMDVSGDILRASLNKRKNKK